MFFDFSSAFNTIQPRLLGDKLQLAGVDHHLTTWILDYLTHRPQFVRVQGFESDRLLCSTGAPQGTVLAPFLFTLYTADFSYNTPSCHLQKFSDDSAVVGLITDGDDREYRGLIQDFADWCLRNNLQINDGKTKELVVDFRRCRHSPPAPVSIQGTDIDTVKSYKYLGVHLNDSLDWSDNTNALVKKGNSRLFLLRRLRSFGVQGPLLRTFYDSVVASAIFYGIVCWASSITDRDRRRMDRLDTLTALGSSFSERLLHPRCVKERMNTGYIKGFEADVGTRTTHHIMYPESAMDLDNSTHLMLFPFKIQDLEWLTKAFTTGFYGRSYMPVKANIKANKDLVMVINPAFMRYVHDVWLEKEKKGRYPSTGFMALVLSLHICDEVHVFGFGADGDGNWSHYWEKLKNKKLRTGVHPGNREYAIIQELAEKEKLKFYKGW
ncbi:hypothetical protein L3Q82_003006 [Scortum barcoo]|uniref:Uncharacterized protein n=1 Tax=Scortum barcoo TaxID=214431 RepID=A0ACB8VR13_9TELE|nr:hypothetical protein L3Q82_003006 [Scortum barcoo]